MKKMLTDEQVKTVEDCSRLILQKIGDVRKADGEVRKLLENPMQYSTIYRRGVERAGRHADLALNNAVDEMRDLLNSLASQNQGDRADREETAGVNGDTSSG